MFFPNSGINLSNSHLWQNGNPAQTGGLRLAKSVPLKILGQNGAARAAVRLRRPGTTPGSLKSCTLQILGAVCGGRHRLAQSLARPGSDADSEIV